MNIIEADKKYIAATYSRFPVVIKEGKGSLLKDEDGREYIDMGSGIAVNSFGIADGEWIAAVTRQLSTLQHTSNLYYNEPDVQLAKLLCERTGMQKVFFSNSGAEANECAIKAARKYAAVKKGKGCSTIITLKNSFHGRTLATLAATGQEMFHKDFQPLPAGFDYVEANNTGELLSKAGNPDIAAIMFEVVQGEGGVLPLEKDFVKQIAEICKSRDILMIVDEVQTGNGRTGRLFGYMNYGITPDIVTTAKGLGGGLPIGATLLGEKVKDTLTAGSHGSTFGGNPVCCAGALNILERIDDELLNGVKQRSEYITERLKSAPGVKSVTGMGLMLGIETEKDADRVIKDCRENGVLVIKAKNKVRLLPALNIPMPLLERAVEVIIEACK